MNTSRPVKEYLHIPDQNGDRKLSEGFKATDKQKLVFDAFVQYNITFNKDQRLDALVLVPKCLVVEADVECPIHVRFHGGGFVSFIYFLQPVRSVNKLSIPGLPPSSHGLHTMSES
jgi:hypothetical protein